MEDFRELLTQIGGIRKVFCFDQKNDTLYMQMGPEELAKAKNKKRGFPAPIDKSDTTLEEKKNRLKESIEAKWKANLEQKLKQRTNVTVKVSEPVGDLKKQQARQ